MTALSGLTIIETAERVCGEWTARLLADFGAEVIKIERPGGSPTRRYGPHVAGPDGKDGSVFAYCNTNKKSLVFDLDSEDGRAMLAKLLEKADALVDDHDEDWCAAHGLDAESVRAAYPGLVHCQITPFGQGAPKDRRKAWPINVANAGGWAWHTPSESAAGDVPIYGPGRFLQDFDSGLDAAMATAACLYDQRRTGTGRSIDISEVQVQLSRADIVIGRVLAGDDEPNTGRRRYDMGGPGDVFATKDGFVHLYMTTSRHWNGLREIMGMPEWAEEFPEDWLEFHCTPDRVAVFRDHFRAWVAGEERNDVSLRAQKLGVPLVPVNDAADLSANEQYRHRGFYQQIDGTDYPGVPYRMTASPAQIVSAAPALDADREEVLS